MLPQRSLHAVLSVGGCFALGPGGGARAAAAAPGCAEVLLPPRPRRRVAVLPSGSEPLLWAASASVRLHSEQQLLQRKLSLDCRDSPGCFQALQRIARTGLCCTHGSLQPSSVPVWLQARRVLQLPPRLSTVDSELNSALQQAAMQSSLELDPLFNNVGLRFAVLDASGDPAAADGVSGHGQAFLLCMSAWKQFAQLKLHRSGECRQARAFRACMFHRWTSGMVWNWSTSCSGPCTSSSRQRCAPDGHATGARHDSEPMGISLMLGTAGREACGCLCAGDGEVQQPLQAPAAPEARQRGAGCCLGPLAEVALESGRSSADPADPADSAALVAAAPPCRSPHQQPPRLHAGELRLEEISLDAAPLTPIPREHCSSHCFFKA